VRVEVDVTPGLPNFITVGLPDSAVRESRERVRTAIRNAGFAFPNDRITVNLAPADLRKKAPPSTSRSRSASSSPPAASAATASATSRSSASWPSTARSRPCAARSRSDWPAAGARSPRCSSRATTAPRPGPWTACGCSRRRRCTRPSACSTARCPVRALGGDALPADKGEDLDFRDVRGQAQPSARSRSRPPAPQRAAGGPPGAGKTMLAKRLAAVLPPLSATRCWRCRRSGRWPDSCDAVARSSTYGRSRAHHTISVAGLIGGGSPRTRVRSHSPTAACCSSTSCRSSSSTCSSRCASRSRTGGHHRTRQRGQRLSRALPAHRRRESVSSRLSDPGPMPLHTRRARPYLGRLSGPLLDRIDLHVELPALEGEEYTGARPATTRPRCARG